MANLPFNEIQTAYSKLSDWVDPGHRAAMADGLWLRRNGSDGMSPLQLHGLDVFFGRR